MKDRVRHEGDDDREKRAAASPEQHDRLIRLMRDDPAGAMLRIAHITDPDPQTALTLSEHYRGIRRSQHRVSPDVLPRLYELGYSIDVSDLLPSITAPTLVMGGRDDFVFPPESQGPLPALARPCRIVLAH